MGGEHDQRWRPWAAIGLIIVAFIVCHAALTPIYMLMREAGVGALRAPIFEEAFKVFVVATFIKRGSHFRRALIAGSATGIAETIINVSVTFDSMVAVLVNEAEDLTASLMYVAMGLGITLKLVMAVIGHTFFVYAAAKIVGAWNVYTFLFAAVFHYMANVLIGP
jgi:hypothetical protein